MDDFEDFSEEELEALLGYAEDPEGLQLGAAVRKKVRYPVKKALKTAGKVERKLVPLAKELLLAGSIRRGRPEVADIEFVILPKDLDKFHKAMGRMGYASGPEGRQYKHVIEGIPIEIYVAFAPEEMGSMLLMYTGDYLYNITMRTRAQKMGYKLNQYGIFTRDDEVVFQSPKEEDFFEFLGKEWREPEQRSLAHRQELLKIGRDLKAMREELDPEDYEFVVEAIRRLNREKYLPPKEEKVLRDLHAKHAAKAVGMGQDSIREWGREPRRRGRRKQAYSIEQFQADYDRAVGKGGEVVDAWADVGRFGGIAIWLTVDEPARGRIYYSPYYDQSPSEEDIEAVESDAVEWLDVMLGATDWSEWDWGPGEDSIPAY